MAAFFGIDRTYFDEIDEEKRNELIQKAMYFYQKDGKEIYLYRPNKTPKSHVNAPYPVPFLSFEKLR